MRVRRFRQMAILAPMAGALGDKLARHVRHWLLAGVFQQPVAS